LADSIQRIAEAIFLEVVDLPASDRAAFIESKCGHDSDLKSRVELLLMADTAAGDDNFLADHFLDRPGSSGKSFSSDALLHPYESVGETDRFTILSFHDRGGLGEVLLARDRQLGRDVAVKQILEEWQGHQEASARFLQEAEVTGRLEHPGVVPVYAIGTWPDGRPFYAMRFIEGKTLKQVIKDHRTTSDGEARRTSLIEIRGLLNRFVDVCNTIEYAHSRRVIHRDIKPSNIMIGPYGETLVVDWGLAKRLETDFDDSITAQFIQQLDDEDRSKSDSGRTRIGGAVGTPQYMSPEQASGKINSVGVQTDVYLLGATLYQILTGQPPHQEESVAKLIARIKDGILVPPREIDASVPPALEAICMKAMATNPTHRYPVASALARDIERWLADEPVSVFSDPPSARLGRWTRKHPALSLSGAVAAALLTVCCIVGSMLWSYQQTQKFKLEKERSSKAAQLLASQNQRHTETQESAESAWQMSGREIEASRLDSALAILRRSGKTLKDQPQFHTERKRIADRLGRLEKLTEFYRQAELCEQFNVMSRDTQGIMAATAALQALGVWDKADWWRHLPETELNAQQRDQLRWDVYQQWLMLDGMLVKTIGTRLFGIMQKGGGGRLLRALRRMQTGAGVEEAEAALIVSDRIDFFRQAESARWYRGIARYRTRTGHRVKAEDLETPRNAADAQKMGVLCLLSAMDPSFRVVFRDYKNQDAISAGRDLFQRSASLRPDHYWTQLGLGQMQYFIAKREAMPTWQSYQPAVQTMGRCIAINPKSCFAYADRSSLFRFQHQALQNEFADPSMEQNPDHQQQMQELLLWSMQDAQTAYRLGSKSHPWVGWTYGMALAAAGQHDQAADVLLKASLQTFPLLETGDSTLIAADDIRGRQEAAQYVARRIEQEPTQPQLRTLLASIYLNQQEHESAMELMQNPLSDPNTSAHGHAIRGMLRLDSEDSIGAEDHFRKAIEKNPNHIWAVYGLATLEDRNGDYTSSLDLFRQATDLATNEEHRAACLLGTGRVLALLGRYNEALDAFKSAQVHQAACNLAEAAKPLVVKFKKLRSEFDRSREADQLESFLKSLAGLPRATKVEISNPPEDQPIYAALLGGDFELGQLRYWSNEFGIDWLNRPGYQAIASVDHQQQHQGRYSFHIVGGHKINHGKVGGSTAQSFPVPAQSNCRLSVWVKTNELNPGSARLEIRVPGRSTPTELLVPGGTQDWTEMTVDFQAGQVTDLSLTVVPVTLTIVSAGPGEVWYDDLEVTLTRSPEDRPIED
jgi:serine/threonine protein kinase/Flp pilus assembly protein TadD